MQSLVRYFSRVLFLSALCLLAAAPGLQAQSQMTAGTINGTVTDEGGGVLPGASVALRNLGTGLERALTTDEAGRFSAPLLPVGDYEVTASLPGFATVRRSGITLSLGQTLVVDVQLKVAGREETVTVTSAAPIIETEKSETSTLVNQREVSSLPLNGRRFLDLAFLTPGVSQDRERGQLTFSGSRGLNSNINIDGADFNQPFFGGQRGGERTNDAYVVSQEAIREFQVVRGNFNAEFGRSTGGVVNVITKAGTNDFHGGAFYYVRPKGAAAHNFFGEKVSPNRHQFGGSLGGPFVKDRTFFFTVYDQQVQRQDLIVRFSGDTALLPSNILAQQGNFRSTNDVNTYLIKVDHQLNKQHSLQTRYNYSRNYAENGTTTGSTSRALTSNGLERDRSHTTVANLSSIFSPTLLNEFRWQYSFEGRPRLNNGEGPDFVNRVGPEITIQGCCTLGGVSFLPNIENDSRLQFADNISVIRGRHSWKFGYDFNRSHVDQTFRGNWRGFYQFRDVAHFVTNLNNPNTDDLPQQFRLFFGNGNFDAHVFEHALFAQDTIKVLPNLTINLGLRYESFLFPQPTAPNPDLPLTARIHSDKKMWQPRFGLTWDPTKSGRTVVRVGGGLFHARTPLLLLNQAFNSNGNLALGGSFTLSTAQIRQVRTAHPEFVFPFVPNTSASNVGYFTEAVRPRINPDASFFSDDFRNPRALQYTAAVEHEINSNFAASLDYVHVNTVWLERIRDVNLGTPTLTQVDNQPRWVFPSTRPNTNYNILRQQENSARSNYDSVSLSLKGRRMAGLSFLTSYTLAYNRDDDSNERNFNGITYEDVNNLRAEYRWSRNDIRHRWVASSVYDVPINTTRYGIQLSTIIEYRTGTPFSAFTGVDSNNDGQITDRPIIGGIPLLRNSFRQPNFLNQDLRVTQGYKINERQRLDFIVEFFNVWNKENYFYSANSNESSGAAGSVWGRAQTPNPRFRNRDLRFSAPGRPADRGAISAGRPLELQLALKYTF